MEIALRRLEGVDKISISISEQRFQVTYKSGAVSSHGTFATPWRKREWKSCGSELLPEAVSMKKGEAVLCGGQR